MRIALRPFITITFSLLAGTASAGDAISTPAAHPVAGAAETAPYDWSGRYAGIAGGYGWMDGYFDPPAGYPPTEDPLNGTVLGAFAGVSAQFDNNLVLGIEGDVEYNIQDVTVTAQFGTFTGGADWQGSARLRLGYAFDRLLIYTTAGWAATHLEAEYIGVSTTTASFHGYTLGAGMDYAVTDRIFSRIDYRYNDFGTSELDFGAASIGADLTQHTVKFGLGVKF